MHLALGKLHQEYRQNLGLLLQPRNKTVFLLKEKPFLHIQRKQGKSGHVCDNFTFKALFIRDLFLEPKWWTSITACRFYNIWGCKSARSIRNNGRTGTGWLTRTVCCWTLLCPCNSFWPLKRGHGHGPQSYLFAWFGLSMNVSCFQKKNCRYKGVASRTFLKFRNSCCLPHTW